MNKKGFAVTTMLYGIVFVTIAIFFTTIRIASFRVEEKDKFADNVREDLNEKLPSGQIQSSDNNDSDRLIDEIKTKAYQEKEIIAINKEGNKCESLSNCDIREYRYSGPEVNNYIYLEDNNNGNELWRVIGIFKDEDTNEEYIKVIREESLPSSYLPQKYTLNSQTYYITGSDAGSVHWNYNEENFTNSTNNWSTAGLQYYLNVEQDSNGIKGYLNYLSNKTKELLKTNVKYYLGSVSPTDNAVTSYQHERDIKSCIENKGKVNSSENFPNSGCNVWDGNDASWIGMVGLIYPSDIIYSSESENWSRQLYENDEYTFDNATTWMFHKSTWKISPSSSSINIVGGDPLAHALPDIYGTVWYNNNYVRPVLSLKYETIKLSGDGTKEKPYVIIDNLSTNFKERIKAKAYNDNEIIAINKNGEKCEKLDGCDIREYRYSGNDANNYISLTDNENKKESWRIIGIFTDEDTNEEYIKILRDEPLFNFPENYSYNKQLYKILSPDVFFQFSNFENGWSSAYWNNGNKKNNNWAEAGLQYYLNSDSGYLKYLSDKTKSLLKTDVKHYLGTVDSTDTVYSVYKQERDIKECQNNTSTKNNQIGCNIWSGNAATWVGTVALMYASDIGYASDSRYWSNQNIFKNVNWLYRKIIYGNSDQALSPGSSGGGSTMEYYDYAYYDTWTISPSSLGKDKVIRNNSDSTDESVFEAVTVQPVLYLKESVYWLDGIGTKEKPYEVDI